MKKMIACLLSLVLCSVVLPLRGIAAEASVQVLHVYNCQDYIDDGTDSVGVKVSNSVMEDWAEDYFSRTGKRVRVQYDTYETNETMLNTLKTGKAQYDLVCPSDYVIQKMILATEKGTDESLFIEPFDYSVMENYQKYSSPYIRQIFEENGFSGYSVGYMWGTVGILYNPESVAPEDTRSWDIFLNPDYKNRSTLKDSVREGYLSAMAVAFHSEITALNEALERGELSVSEFNEQATALMNRTDEEAVSAAGRVLKDMKNNIYGLEVDNGKSDIVAGKIDINQAWSGDAVYSMDMAEEENDVLLSYAIPEDGCSIWFDGWVMPKGANVELAQDFVNYLCDPSVAARNMDFIGYTSVVAGDEIFELLLDWYGDEDGDYTVDLTYFFDGTVSEDYYSEGKILVQTAEIGRQFSAQYPEKSVVDRCYIMKDFGDRNDAVLQMWTEFKANNVSLWLLFLFALILVGACVLFLLFTKPKRDSARRRREWAKHR